MEEMFQKIRKLVELMGFDEPELNFDSEHRKVSLLVDDSLVNKDALRLLEPLDHIVNLMAKKNPQFREGVLIDVNNYRKERERLIVELAKAAAHKALMSKENIELPPMNGYERRLVHMEIASRPDLKTESVGEGRERRVIIKII